MDAIDSINGVADSSIHSEGRKNDEKVSQQEEEAAQQKEIPWRDDQIRFKVEEWKRREVVDEEEERGEDIFADPHPYETFHFEFPIATNNNPKAIQQIELRGYKQESDAIYNSTGLTLWRASHDLCQYMIQHAPELRQERSRILELGAGLGLCGILISQLCPDSTVCITDGDTDALVYLRENVQRNHQKHRHHTAGAAAPPAVAVSQLLWGNETAQTFLKQQQQPFDFILASDIIYAPCIIPPLWETLAILLQRPQGLFVLAFAKRPVPVSLDHVLETADQAGFTHRPVTHDDEQGIYVYEFRWK